MSEPLLNPEPHSDPIATIHAYVESLSIAELRVYTCKYLKLIEAKRLLNHVYRQQSHVKQKRRQYYYIRNDIYHPVYNRMGTIEKRHKRSP